MVMKSKDVVEIENSEEDLDQVLRDAVFGPELRAALRAVLNELQDHPLNAGRGKAAVLVPGTNVHFRLAPTLYTAFTAVLGVAVTLGTVPVNPVLAGAAATLTMANVIKDIGGLFNRLNAQEAAVVGALAEAIERRRQTDPKARDATAAQVESVFRERKQAPPAVPGTLQKLMQGDNAVLKTEARNNDIFYSIAF
ncbi:MAG: hypothetical protein AB7I59_03335 [Geminicoccaceae bacterium]